MAVPAVALARVGDTSGRVNDSTRTSSDVAARIGTEPGPELRRPLTVPEVPIARLARVARVPNGVGPSTSLGQGVVQVGTELHPSSGTIAFAPGPRGGRVADALAADQGALWGGPPPRGGGPEPIGVRSVLRTEDQTRTFPVVLPVGCTRLSAVGTPRVRDLALEVTGPDGRRSVGDARRGHPEAMTVCAREEGTYVARVRMRGAGGVVASEVFVNRAPAAVERTLR
jgi:hypothetical protein